MLLLVSRRRAADLWRCVDVHVELTLSLEETLEGVVYTGGTPSVSSSMTMRRLLQALQTPSLRTVWACNGWTEHETGSGVAGVP